MEKRDVAPLPQMAVALDEKRTEPHLKTWPRAVTEVVHPNTLFQQLAFALDRVVTVEKSCARRRRPRYRQSADRVTHRGK
jgi:hypothetical protein